MSVFIFQKNSVNLKLHYMELRESGVTVSVSSWRTSHSDSQRLNTAAGLCAVVISVWISNCSMASKEREVGEADRILNVNLSSKHFLNERVDKAVCQFHRDRINRLKGYILSRHHEKGHEEIRQIKQRTLKYFPIQWYLIFEKGRVFGKFKESVFLAFW